MNKEEIKKLKAKKFKAVKEGKIILKDGNSKVSK